MLMTQLYTNYVIALKYIIKRISIKFETPNNTKSLMNL